MRSTVGRVVGLLLSVGFLVAAVLVVRDEWAQVRTSDLLPGAAPIAAAVAAHLVADGVLVQVWRRVLATGGLRLAFGTASWIWSLGQLTRYTFIAGVQVGGRAVAGRPYGVSLTAGAVSTLVEIAWQLAITSAVALATAPWALRASDDVTWLAWAAVAPALFLLALHLAPRAVLRATGAVLGRVRTSLREALDAVELTRVDALVITGWFVINTALRLVAFLVLFAAVGGDLPGQTLLAIGAWALGQLAGRLAVFSPGGIGPQEGVTVLVLSSTLGAGALVLAAVSRVTEVVAELLFLALARVLRRSTLAA